eukprot:2881550-Prymnesium_polylepis.1
MKVGAAQVARADKEMVVGEARPQRSVHAAAWEMDEARIECPHVDVLEVYQVGAQPQNPRVRPAAAALALLDVLIGMAHAEPGNEHPPAALRRPTARKTERAAAVVYKPKVNGPVHCSGACCELGL